MSKLAIITACIVLGAIISFGSWLAFDTSDRQGVSLVRSSTIVYDGHRFEPAAIIAASGSKIKFINQGNGTLIIAADQRSAHKNPELDVGGIDPGVSKTITITAQGTWGFSNQQLPEHRGTIRIE